MTRYGAMTQPQSEFREVFRNGYVMGFAPRALLGTIFCLIFGLLFSAFLLYLIVYLILSVAYIGFGVDLFDIKETLTDWKPSLKSIIEAVIAGVVWLALFAYLGPQNLIRVKRRLASRFYVMAGRPLAVIEGRATFDPSSESGYNGIEVGEFYFDLDTDCWLIKEEELETLERAGGVMRIWYIPKDVRSWINPKTGRLVKYNVLLVRAEWRPTA